MPYPSRDGTLTREDQTKDQEDLTGWIRMIPTGWIRMIPALAVGHALSITGYELQGQTETRPYLLSTLNLLGHRAQDRRDIQPVLNSSLNPSPWHPLG